MRLRSTLSSKRNAKERTLLGIYVYAFLYWPCSVTGDEPNMGVSLSAALPTFWISFAVMLCTWIAFQVYFIRQCVRK